MSKRTNMQDAGMTARLERLAAGELDEADRTGVLAWLEEDPCRWRHCGLAFLEAQVCSEALGGWAPTVKAACGAPRRISAFRPRGHSRPWAAMLVSAASLLIAFGLGLAARDIAGRDVRPSQDVVIASSNKRVTGDNLPVLASLSVQQDSALGLSGAIQIPVVPRLSADNDAAAPAEIPEYVREQWERRGFELISERRYLFAELPDGEPIVVPVDQVLVHSVPQQVY